MAIPVMLDGDSNHISSKYTKRSSAYRTRAQYLLSILLLPAAATVTTDVWFQSATVSSAFGYDLVLAVTNVSGAFLDGFFAAWEYGVAVPSGAKTEALHMIADDMRAFYLSTYTSWAGMVSVAASLAHARSSPLVGIVYILLSILCAFVSHGELCLLSHASIANCNSFFCNSFAVKVWGATLHDISLRLIS